MTNWCHTEHLLSSRSSKSLQLFERRIELVVCALRKGTYFAEEFSISLRLGISVCLTHGLSHHIALWVVSGSEAIDLGFISDSMDMLNGSCACESHSLVET